LIAIGAMLSSPRRAAALLDELSRAAIRPDAAVPFDIIGLGSTAVCFESDGPRSRYHRAEIVAPEETEPGLGRVSVLTDLGAALIGLAQHQSITWRDPRGGARQLAVLEVMTPEHQAQPAPDERSS
jgi:regulator of nucleoside diphosphate kinase